MLSLQSLCMHDVVVYCLKIVVINPSVGRCGPWFQSNCSATVAFQSATTRQTRCRPEISTHDKQRTTTTKIMNDFVRCLSRAVVYSMNRTDGFVEMKLIVARTFVHCFLLSRCTSLSLFFFSFSFVFCFDRPRFVCRRQRCQRHTLPAHYTVAGLQWHDTMMMCAAVRRLLNAHSDNQKPVLLIWNEINFSPSFILFHFVDPCQPEPTINKKKYWKHVFP